MTKTMIVLDNSVLRNEKFIKEQISQGKQLVILTTALSEMEKNIQKWAKTAYYSLRFLAPYPETIVVANLNICRRLELETGIPTQCQAIRHKELTLFLRRFLAEPKLEDRLNLIQNTTQVFDLYAIYEPKAHLQLVKYIDASRLEHRGPHIDKLRKRLSNKDDQKLTSDDLKYFREFLLNTLTLEKCRKWYLEQGPSESIVAHISALSASPSLTYLYRLALDAVILWWTVRNGYQNSDPKAQRKRTNNVIDNNYIIAGLWAGELATSDKRLCDRFEDLKSVIAALWPEHAKRFNEAQVTYFDKHGATKPTHQIAPQ